MSRLKYRTLSSNFHCHNTWINKTYSFDQRIFINFFTISLTGHLRASLNIYSGSKNRNFWTFTIACKSGNEWNEWNDYYWPKILKNTLIVRNDSFRIVLKWGRGFKILSSKISWWFKIIDFCFWYQMLNFNSWSSLVCKFKNCNLKIWRSHYRFKSGTQVFRSLNNLFSFRYFQTNVHV